MIDDGVLDGDDIEALAKRLGVGSRQPPRLLIKYLGRRTECDRNERRAHLARVMLDRHAASGVGDCAGGRIRIDSRFTTR